MWYVDPVVTSTNCKKKSCVLLVHADEVAYLSFNTRNHFFFIAVLLGRFSKINILQGRPSVATHLKFGDIFNDHFVANFLQNLEVENAKVGKYLTKILTWVKWGLVYMTSSGVYSDGGGRTGRSPRAAPVKRTAHWCQTILYIIQCTKNGTKKVQKKYARLFFSLSQLKQNHILYSLYKI